MVALLIAGLVLGSDMLQALNQRLDHALYAGHAAKLVVAGRIVEISTSAQSDHPGLRLRVDRVILGPTSEEGRTLEVDIQSFDWPSTLVSPEVGRVCVLVLRRDGEHERVEAVVPVRQPALPRARDGEEVKQVLGREILSMLADERSPGRQRLLILQVAPILRPDQARQITPFLHSTDPWVRRAALAALVYATAAEPYLRLAAADVQHFFESTRNSDLIDGIEPGVRYAAYPFFFSHYFFLEPRSWRFGSRWDEAEGERNRRLVQALRQEGSWTKDVARIIDVEP